MTITVALEARIPLALADGSVNGYNEQEYIGSCFKGLWNPIIIGPKTVGMVTALVDRNGASIDYGQDYTVGNLKELVMICTS